MYTRLMNRGFIRRIAALAALGAATAVAGCAPTIDAPTDKGVCWNMVAQKKGKVKFFKVSANEPDLEHCAAALEGMRLRFLLLGGSTKEVDGAYQGQFLFVDQRGVFTSSELGNTPFPFLIRDGSGHLVPPGTPPN
jgi:hypothetical protein